MKPGVRKTFPPSPQRSVRELKNFRRAVKRYCSCAIKPGVRKTFSEKRSRVNHNFRKLISRFKAKIFFSTNNMDKECKFANDAWMLINVGVQLTWLLYRKPRPMLRAIVKKPSVRQTNRKLGQCGISRDV